MIKFATENSLNETEITNLVEMINEVYDDAEGDLFKSTLIRTSNADLREVINAGNLIILYHNGLIKGCIQLNIIDLTTASFGMLAVAKDSRFMNFGKSLIEFAENHAKSTGCSQMQLELLTPKFSNHKHNEFLKTWYIRCGYNPITQNKFSRIDDLAIPCDFTLYSKNLILSPSLMAQ